MRKIISIFLISTLILTLLCGCEGSENNVSSDVSQIEAVINMSSEETPSETENISSQETSSETENNNVQTIEKRYSNVTIDDDFNNDCVFVMLNKETSKQIIDRVFTAEDFGLDNCESIKKITLLSEAEKQYAQKVWAAEAKEGSSFNYESIDNPTLLKLKNYRAIIKINLKDKSKENVIKAIKHLEKIDFVYCAEPNYIYTPYSTNVNDVELDEQ